MISDLGFNVAMVVSHHTVPVPIPVLVLQLVPNLTKVLFFFLKEKFVNKSKFQPPKRKKQ